jgi:hypothetical protein
MGPCAPCPLGKYGEIFNKGWRALNYELFPGPWPSQARVSSHVINYPRHPTRPALITRQHALIRYGRPCDRSHCLVDFNGIFYKVGACLPFALLLFLGFVYNTLVSSHHRLRHQAPQLIVSPLTGTPWRDTSPCDRLLTGFI